MAAPKLAAEREIPRFAVLVAEALARPPREAVRDLLDAFLEQAHNIKRLYFLTVTNFWYRVLRIASEMTKDIKLKGFLVEANVSPSSSYTYEFDLTGTPHACMCPVFVASASLGAWVKLTNLVNESPVDVVESEWIDKYVAQDLPLATDMPSLATESAYPYVYFPKRKVKVTFKNDHDTETARCVFFADYIQVEKDKGENLIRNIFIPFKREVVNPMLKEPEVALV